MSESRTPSKSLLSPAGELPSRRRNGGRPGPHIDWLTKSTRWVLAHRRLVVIVWGALALAGMAAAGPATKLLSDQYTVPGREGYETNAQITRIFGNGGNAPPLVAVIHLPASANAPSGRRDIYEVSTRLQSSLPRARIVPRFGGGSIVSRDGRTALVLAYAPPEKGNFGQSTAAVKRAKTALGGLRIGGSPVRVTGLDALSAESGQTGGLGVAAEATIGGIGALAVLGFVFGSLLALVPLVLALVSIMTSFLFVWGLASVTDVSVLVEFLISLVGLGVAIDYSLLVVARWREEQAAGLRGEEAVVRAMATAGRAVLISGTTVAIGLLALIVLPLPFLRSVGYGGMLIPLVTVAVTLTLLPVILARWGSRLEWPHRRRRTRAAEAWSAWASWVVRHRAATVGVSLTFLAALTVAATSMHLGAASGEPDTISQRGPARTALVTLERSGFGSGALTPIEVLAPAQDVRPSSRPPLPPAASELLSPPEARADTRSSTRCRPPAQAPLPTPSAAECDQSPRARGWAG